MYTEIPIKRVLPEINSLISLLYEVGNCFIAGGFAKYCTSPRSNVEVPGDIDIFCKDDETYAKLIERLESSNFYLSSESTIATTFQIPYPGPDLLVQVIKPVKLNGLTSGGTVEEVLDSFDYTVAKVALIIKLGPVVEALAHPNYKFHERTKSLVIERAGGFGDTFYCLQRLIKYVGKGYKVEDSELLKILDDWDSKPVEEREKIKEVLRSNKRPMIARVGSYINI